MKINVARKLEDGTFVGKEVDESSKSGYDLFIGQLVKLVGKNITLGQTGVISGFSKSSSGNLLCHVNWLRGAPPVKTLCSNVGEFLERPFYLITQVNPSSSDRTTMGFSGEYWSVGRGISSVKYFTMEDARNIARSRWEQHGHEVYVMSPCFVRNEQGGFAL